MTRSSAASDQRAARCVLRTYSALLTGSFLTMLWLVCPGCGYGGPADSGPTPQAPPRRGPSEPVKQQPTDDRYHVEKAGGEWDDESKGAFATAYADAGHPRLAFVVNVAMPDLAADDEEDEEEDEEDVDDLAEAANVNVNASLTVLGNIIIAVPPEEWPVSRIDHRMIEDRHTRFFMDLDPRVNVVDASTVRENLRRQIERSRDPHAEQAEWPCDIVVAIEVCYAVPVRQTFPVEVFCTTRAIRVSDGRILATATPDRETSKSFRDLENDLRWLSESSASAIADQFLTTLPAAQ